MTKLNSKLSRRTSCPIATALDVIGDKWTLLIVRDIGLFGKHRNKDFQDAGENIPTNILADRLKMLISSGLVEKTAYQTNPPRYEYHLSEAGKGLIPVIQSMAVWAQQNINGIKIPNFKK